MSKVYDQYMCRENKYISVIKKYIGQSQEVMYRQDFINLTKEAEYCDIYISAVVLSNVEDKIIDFYFTE
jgi:hypothetical protein